jgi:aminoglycoside phosphotransferase (APT) family kinase protein
LAHILARIHAVPLSRTAIPFLLDANSDAAWFARAATVPKPLLDHEDGQHVWQAVRDLLPRTLAAPPVLTHLDYWPGNMLWHGGEITAVVDWEEAAAGDPGVDVAYARMHLLLLGMNDAARTFLKTYEAHTGCPVANLALWDLAAATRAMPDPARLSFGALGILHCTPRDMRMALRRFIADALRRASSQDGQE